MTASVLLLSCSNKKTTGVEYSSASSSNETNTNETNTEINNNKEDIIKHEGTWSGELKSDNTIEYLPWKFVIKNDASIDVYIYQALAIRNLAYLLRKSLYKKKTL